MTLMDEKPRPKAATLQTIADALGVHRSTVARALNAEERHRITPDVVKRVTEEAERQGYRRDIIAASLRTGKSRLVGVIVPDLANPVFSTILDGVSAALTGRSYSMLVADAGVPLGKQAEIVDALVGRRVDGLILATAMRNDPTVSFCLGLKVPTVLVNRAEDNLRASSVVADDHRGMGLAIAHLAELGHRRIAHIGGPEAVSTGSLRRLGFQDAMGSAGLGATRIVSADSYARSAGASAAKQIFACWPDTTAIAAGNDLLALGALEYMRERGIGCPGEVSLTGFNDMPFIDLVDPALTTIRVPQHEMGKAAADMLLGAIEGPGRPPELQRLPVTLVVRSSSCATASRPREDRREARPSDLLLPRA